MAVECPFMLGSFAVGNVQSSVRAAIPMQQASPKSSFTSHYFKRESAGKKGKGEVALCVSPTIAPASPPTMDDFIRKAVQAMKKWDAEIVEDLTNKPIGWRYIVDVPECIVGDEGCPLIKHRQVYISMFTAPLSSGLLMWLWFKHT
ncbi:hypothetical protein FIBSPDRAFT_896917 [Athelia psychrophila]|uniref:Uncharacterized protein n=1 Tax=Athelia psychrophila TaxID=1759441 RepID=A0A166CWZ1_9AGAM|nr:hypothetical protein FIBSPDRAFT_896917 [Fibularhizoctonia sp. CBS 109695]